MKHRTRIELYDEFIELVRSLNQQERDTANRRMLSVFIWCFVLPTVLAIAGLLLIKFHLVPRSARIWFDGLIILCPVVYAIYFLSSEVLRGAPKAVQKGGAASLLGQFKRDCEWRAQVDDSFRKHLGSDPAEWQWIAGQYQVDLSNLQHRNRYLTLLAGAVFFLINQGIDSIQSDSYIPTNSLLDPDQILGLGLFLLLLYLSGSQAHHSLKRYLTCAEHLGSKSGRPPSALTAEGRHHS